MATQTPNFSFELPEVGADTDVWGGFLNSNWSDLDTLLKTLQDEIAAAEVRAQIPVGGLYFSGSDTTPATTLGYGTWVAHAEGRAIVGVGDNGEYDWSAEETRGFETITLIAGQIPAHTHTTPATQLTANSDGTHTHSYTDSSDDGLTAGGVFVSGGGFKLRKDAKTTGSNGAHTHTVNVPPIVSEATGGGGAHNNIQPSIGVYVWRRTA